MKRWRKRQKQLELSAAEQLELPPLSRYFLGDGQPAPVGAPAPALERNRISKAGGWVKTGAGERGYLISIKGEQGVVRFPAARGWPFPRVVMLPLHVLAPARAPIPQAAGGRQVARSREG